MAEHPLAMLVDADLLLDLISVRDFHDVSSGLAPAVLSLLEHFPEKGCPGLDPGWAPVFRRKCDQVGI
jgi:hypothetical protein